MTSRETREVSRVWFTPRAPDQAVRQWGHTLARTGRQQVLDVGCGGGRHAVYLSRLGLAVTAGDQSPLALWETRRWLERERLNARLLALEMTMLPFGDGAFDAVLSVNVLHHAQPAQARAAVREVWRVLKPGGLFLAVLTGLGECHCFLERPLQPTKGMYECTPSRNMRPPLCNEQDMQRLFAGFRILGTQRHFLNVVAGTGPPGWQGVNWRIWAERSSL